MTESSGLWVALRTFTCAILECGDVALDGFEGFLRAFHVLDVGVPFCGFFGEARVVDFLVRHGVLL